MKRRNLSAIICIAVMSLVGCVSICAAEETPDIFNNIYYPQSTYNGGVNQSPQEETPDIHISPATGSLNITVTDLSLPGKNGFDLNLTRHYSSTDSAIFEPYMQEISTPVDVNYYAICGMKRTYVQYMDGTFGGEADHQVYISPDYFEYVDTQTANWMILNASKFEYEFSDSLPKKYLFSSITQAQAAAAQLNSISYEIEGYMPYAKTLDYDVDYHRFSVKVISKEEVSNSYRSALMDDTTTERYSKLGAGWAFDFPYIEIRKGYDDMYEYLHFGSKGTWLIDTANEENGLVGYNLNDISIAFDTSVTHDGQRSEHCVTEKNGTKHYFGMDGRLLLQQDRYGNQIKFYCQTETYLNAKGDRQNYPYISRIVDTVGREVVFTFETDSYGDKYVYMTVTNPSDASDIRQYTYYLAKMTADEMAILNYSECDDLIGQEWVLTFVEDDAGNYWSYSYDFAVGRFSFVSRNARFYSDYFNSKDADMGNTYVTNGNDSWFTGIRTTYALLDSMQDNRKEEHSFNYAPFVKNCTPHGSMIFYKVYECFDDNVRDYSGTSRKANHKTYLYDVTNVGEYDGYISYGEDNDVVSNYNYTVKVVDKNPGTGKTSEDIYRYTYYGSSRGGERTILLAGLTGQGTDHKTVTDYTYNSATKLLTGTTTTNYSVSDPSQTMTTSVAYTYDTGGYGDLISETPNGTADRSTSYTYDSTYHFPLTKTYKQNSTDTVREEYVKTADGKGIEYANTYVNNVLKSSVRYAYDSYGNVINQKQYLNDTDYVEAQYVYENGANLLSETVKSVKNNDNQAVDVSGSAVYDYWGQPISRTDGNGNTTLYEYDSAGRIVKIINPDSSTKRYRYANESTYEYDELENEIRTKCILNHQLKLVRNSSLGLDNIEYFYNGCGLPDAIVQYEEERDEEGYQKLYSRVMYTYDTAHRPITKTVYDQNNSPVSRETYSYDVVDGCIKQTVCIEGGTDNPTVISSEYTDQYGNVVKKTVGTSTETYTYDYMGNQVSAKSANANANNWSETATAEYDHQGNVTKTTDELGNVVRNEYDRLGRLVKAYDPNNYAAEYKYDALGRLIEQKIPFEEADGTVYYSVKKLWYDNNGNVVKEQLRTNAPGEAESFSEVCYTYDNRGRLTMTETKDGEASNYVQYYYDAKGNLLRTYTGLSSPLTINGLDDVTGADTDFAVTKHTYDVQSKLVSTTDALGVTETNVYDNANGLLLSSTDRKGQIFNYTYDGAGKLLSKTLADGTNAESTTYGLTGVPLTKQNSASTISYTYNDKGQLVSESDSSTGAAKTYTYDANGNRISMTVTKNGTTEISQSYAYDKLNRLISVSEGGNVIATYTYDKRGNRISTAAGGETTAYAYNLANMLTSQTTGNKLSESYTYYLNGNQKSKTSNGQTTNYTYDGMNRLKSENNVQYSFDDFGNRAAMTGDGKTTTYTYDLNNRLTQSVETAGDTTTTSSFNYDPNGNQISKSITIIKPEGEARSYSMGEATSSHIAFYDYDCYNRLAGVDTNGVVSTYTYLPDGMRHSKTVDGVTTTFVYDGANIIEEVTPTDTKKYYRGIEIVKNDDNLYYIYNGQGDVAIITNAEDIVANYIFDAYGNQSEENAIYNPFGYRGEYTDSESGLIYLRARLYDPETGRFINEDPIKDGLNWYVYAGNNPILFIDPFGLRPTVWEAAEMAEHIYKDIPLSDNRSESAKATNRAARTVAGWRLIDVFDGGSLSSIKLGIYIPDKDDWKNPSEYALVYRGSTTNLDMETASVWVNNLLSYGSSASVDMWAAIGAAMYFDYNHSQEITFVGHSKGGGEAIAAATATNNGAITFNAANFNFKNYGLLSEANKKEIVNYYVNGEFLSSLIGPSRYGTTKRLSTKAWINVGIGSYNFKIPDPINNHKMKYVKEALIEEGLR